MDRRKFLKYAGCGAMSSATMMSSILNLRAMNAASIAHSAVYGANDYKAIVCLSLNGGNDSYNMLIPTDTDEYNDYAVVRSNLAIERQEILPLSGNTGGRTFGLHPSLTNLKALYDQGDAAFIANVGTLVEPVSVDEFWLEQKRTPLGLLSHNDQLQQWQTGITHDRAGLGWGGRMADLINDIQPPYNLSDKISMNISLAGTNVWQSGVNSGLYSISPEDGPVGFIGYDEYPFLQRAVDNLIDQNYEDVFKKTYIQGLRNSRDAFVPFTAAYNNVSVNTSFNESQGLSRSLYQVAKSIGARHELGFRRQSYFVDIGGFDTHDELLGSHATLFDEIDSAIGSFMEALDELGERENVIVFAISDFARTLGSNGNGTDHAWGGNIFTIGGPVNGGQIYGQYPQTLDFNENPNDLGGGIILPTTAVDEYFAEIAMWFGVPKRDLSIILPNISNFYDVGSSNEVNPLGFLTLS